jgi:vancomycin resistance protein YoaR
VTTADVFPVPGEVDTAPRRRIWPRLLAGFVVGFVLCIGLAGGALLAYDAGHDGRVLTGVSVADVDLSALDYDGASATLGAAFAGFARGQIVIRTTAGEVVVPYAAFSRRADVGAMVDEAMRTGRSGNVLERAVAEVRLALGGVSLTPRVTLDPTALTTEVQGAVTPLGSEPVDSQVFMSAGSVYAVPARAGRTFDATAAAAAAFEVLRRLDAPSEVVVEAVVTPIPPGHGDGEALAARNAAQRMMANVVVSLGKKQWTIPAATVKGWIRFETRADGGAWPTVDEAAIAASLAKVSKGVRLAPVSATFLKAGRGRIVGVVASRDGRQLDAAATASDIAEALTGRAMGAAAVPVPAATINIPPKVSTADALVKGPLMVRLGTWKTWFPVDERNYWGANIWRPAEIIDGTVLYPGQRFEWWSALGPISTARGFGPGGFIAGDHTEPTGALGGGMCSSSTTLFNAALRAGLQMGSRSNHRYYIYRYPLGLDATVSKTAGGGTQTMSFTNDMKTPIVIRSFRYRASGKGWVRYEIWGIPDGRKVSLSNPIINNLREAVTHTVYVSTLKRGARKQTEYPANGMDVSVTRVVRDRNGAVIHRDTYGTHYALWNGLIEIGR